MNQDLQKQAIFNLLNLCDKDSIDIFHFQDHYKQPLVENKGNKANTLNLRNTKYNRLYKIKTQNDSSSLDNRPVNCTQNKENLKKMLEKLKNSPVKQNNDQKVNSKRIEFDIKHIRVLKSEPASLAKHKEVKEINRYKRSIKQFNVSKENQVIKTLIKAKIIEKLKKNQPKIQNSYGNVKKHNYLHNISTLRQIQKTAKKLQYNQSKQKNVSINLLIDEQNINQGIIFSRRNSRINLKNLIF